jgi:SAM-dependent methyltransferase
MSQASSESYLYTVGNRTYTKKAIRLCRRNITKFFDLALPLIADENYTAVVTGRVLYDITKTYDFDCWLMGPITHYEKLEQLILNLYDIAYNVAELMIDIKWSSVPWAMYYDPVVGQVVNKDAENIIISYCELKDPNGNNWLSDYRIDSRYTPVTEWLVKSNFKDTPVYKFKPHQIECVKKYGKIKSVSVEEFLQNLDHYLEPIEKPLPKFDFDPDSRYLQRHNKNLYNIFSEDIEIDYSQAKVLDFGCNQGNYLYHARNIVNPSRYIGIDLNFLSIEAAKTKHPEYKFVHYNKWHPSYNPFGNKNIKLTDFVDTDFDVVIAYSVLTHTTIKETKRILDELYHVIKPGGTILFTIWLTEHFYNFYNCVKHIQKNIILDDYADPKFDIVMHWTDYKTITVDVDDLDINVCGSLCTFYQKDSFEILFPDAKFIKKVTDGATQWLYRIDKIF